MLLPLHLLTVLRLLRPLSPAPLLPIYASIVSSALSITCPPPPPFPTTRPLTSPSPHLSPSIFLFRIMRYLPVPLYTLSLCLLDASSTIASALAAPPHPLYTRCTAPLKRWAKAIKRDVCTLALAALDSRTPTLPRVVAMLTV